MRYSPIIAAVLLVVLASGIFGYLAFTNPKQLNDGRLYNAWFDADIPFRFLFLTDEHGRQFQTYKHPLFPLLYFPVRIIHKTFQFDYPAAIALLLTLNVALWSTLVFILCHHITRKVFDSCVYTLLSFATASSIFWLPVTETYPFGSTSILIPLFVVITPLLSSNIFAHAIALFCASAITITNAMVAIVAQVIKLRWRRAAIALLSGTFLLLSANVLEKTQFPHANYLLHPKHVRNDFNSFSVEQPELIDFMEKFLLTPLTPAKIYCYRAPKVRARKRDILSWALNKSLKLSMIPPKFKIRYSTIYESPRALYSVLQSVWVILLSFGMLSAIRSWRDLSISPILLISLFGQFVLHLIYGPETFLFSLHWMPLMVMISATNSRHKWRYVALVFATVLIVGCACCNLNALSASRKAISSVNLDALKWNRRINTDGDSLLRNLESR